MTWRYRLIARVARWLRVRVRFDDEPVPQVRGVLPQYEPTRWALNRAPSAGTSREGK